MKFIIQFIAIVATAFVFELFLPWWSVALAAFICGYFFKSKANFLAGLLGVGVLWIAKAWLMDVSASAPLADRVAALFSLNKTLLLVITALIGGLVGGFASMAGGSLKKEKKRYY
jgi:hypothetical protein